MTTDVSNNVMCMINGDPEVSNWYGQGTVQNTHVLGHFDYWHYPFVPYYNSSVVIEDKTKKAFVIAKKLIKSKFMKADKVSDFIELVEMIEKEL